MMYSPDCVLGAAERNIKTTDLDPEVDKRLRDGFQMADWTNGRCDGGLQTVYSLLHEGSWPKTAAERDELCRRWGCSSRQLYQWRREVLYIFMIALQEHWLQAGLPTYAPKPQ